MGPELEQFNTSTGKEYKKILLEAKSTWRAAKGVSPNGVKGRFWRGMISAYKKNFE